MPDGPLPSSFFADPGRDEDEEQRLRDDADERAMQSQMRRDRLADHAPTHDLKAAA